MNRKAEIEAMIAENPSDLFLQYALVLEQKKELSEQAFVQLLIEKQQTFPTYAPFARLLGEFFLANELDEKALYFFRIALNLAEKENDEKAIKELKSKIEFLDF